MTSRGYLIKKMFLSHGITLYLKHELLNVVLGCPANFIKIEGC